MLTDFHDQVPGHLEHPPVVWVGDDTKDPHALAGVFDDGEDVEGGAVEQGDGEEAGREDRPRLTAQELCPGRPRPRLPDPRLAPGAGR